MSELDRVIEKVLGQSNGFTRRELELLGVSWPPRKGWRKKLIRQIKGLPEKPIRKEVKQYRWPSKDGYLVRATGTGKHHLYINGMPVCRGTLSKAKYVYSETKPKNEFCALCEAALVEDPQNTRLSQRRTRSFYGSWEWKKLRYETLKKYGAKCMLCGGEEHCVVDHIKPVSRYPDLAMDPGNLQVLCNACNQGKSNDDETDFRPSESVELEIVAEARRHLH